MFRIKHSSVVSSHQRRSSVRVSAIDLTRRDTIIAAIGAPLLLRFDAMANELIPEGGEVKMSDEVKKRKERLAAKAAAKERVTADESKSSGGSSQPVKARKESSSKSSLIANPTKTADQAAGKAARLAALREKAAKIRAGGEPTF